MVLPRSLLLLCVAAALALSDVGTASAEVATRELSGRKAHEGLTLPYEVKRHAKEAPYEHGTVETTASGRKKHRYHHDQAAVEEEEHHGSSIRVHVKKHSQSAKETPAVATSSEVHHPNKRHYQHGRHHAKKTETKEEETKGVTTHHPNKRHYQHGRRHAKKTEATGENGEVVRTYEYGTVSMAGVDSNTATSDGTTAVSKKHRKHHQRRRRHHAKKDAVAAAGTDGETVETYEHGSTRTTANGATATDAKKHHERQHHHRRHHHAKKHDEAQADVKSTADEVTELATKLASTSTDEAGQGFFTNSFAPIVMICGIIGSLALVIGVVALVTTRPNQESVDVSSVLDADIDMEANVSAAEAEEDAPAERRDSLLDSDSNSDSDDDEAAEGTFANSSSASV